MGMRGGRGGASTGIGAFIHIISFWWHPSLLRVVHQIKTLGFGISFMLNCTELKTRIFLPSVSL